MATIVPPTTPQQDEDIASALDWSIACDMPEHEMAAEWLLVRKPGPLPCGCNPSRRVVFLCDPHLQHCLTFTTWRCTCCNGPYPKADVLDRVEHV